MQSFTAIDFETACHDRASICQVGLVRVEGGEIVRELDILVQPPGNYYHPIFTGIHGITPEMTKAESHFWDIWDRIEPYIRNQTVVAHNISFDESCLRAVLKDLLLDPLEFNSKCTYRIFGKALHVLCEEHRIQLDHHNALSDAKACAKLYQIHLRRQNTSIHKVL